MEQQLSFELKVSFSEQPKKPSVKKTSFQKEKTSVEKKKCKKTSC